MSRIESDSMGTIEVPSDRYWGAQTQRSLQDFDIGRPTFVWGQPDDQGSRCAQEVRRTGQC